MALLFIAEHVCIVLTQYISPIYAIDSDVNLETFFICGTNWNNI